MSGQDIPLLDRFRSSWNILRAYRTGTLANVETALRHHRRMMELIDRHAGAAIERATILDVGCGQTATQTALFRAEGASVVGIDIEIPTYRMSPKVFLHVARTNGFERAVKSALRHALFDRRFLSELSSRYGKPISHEGIEIRTVDADRLSFPDDHFDFVHSSWVFEHVENVRGAVREVNRVLKPSGAAWIGAHLFPSPSGGHHLEWIDPDRRPSSKVPPWDHLFEKRFPVNTYLNGLKLDQYREIFATEIAVIDEVLTREGEDLLTPQVEERARERGFSREDLLTRTLECVCRKKGS